MVKILFFNGWGMDDQAVPEMVPEKGVILNYPYLLPAEVDLHTGEWVAIGWSFGAYYLNKFIEEHPELKFKQVIAINGHGAMLGKMGIREKMLDLTIKTLTPESLQAFYKNMALPEEKANKTRTFAEIKGELEAFGANYKPMANRFTKAFVSDDDRIVPTKAMVNYFTQENVDFELISAPHYPFELLNTWDKIVGEA